MLVAKWREAKKGNGGDKGDVRPHGHPTITSTRSPTLRNKKDLILDFVDRVSASGDIDEEWRAYVAARRAAELDAIITDENLEPDETRAFVDRRLS